MLCSGLNGIKLVSCCKRGCAYGEGWEYKRWADVLTIINGKNQKAVESPNGQYPIYGSGGIMGYALDWLCPENCVIIGRKGNINKPLFVESKFWNVDTAFGLSANQECLIPKYLFYFCLDYNFERHNRAVTIPSLTKIDLLKVKMLVPPKPTQLSIVSELDKLNELILIKKEQLKDYDTLAQSIFYEMFGDPVENEKGWKVKKLMEVCDVRDGTHDSPKYVESSNYMLITSKNIVNRAISFDDVNYITEEDYNNINKRSKVDNGDILMPMIGTIGNPVIVYLDNLHKFSIKNVALIKFLHNTSILNRYLLELMISESFRRYLLSLNKGGNQKFVALGTIRRMDIILPPLPLQQSFAHKIEQIDRQKAAVQRTIKDLETLLAARMQYWFD